MRHTIWGCAVDGFESAEWNGMERPGPPYPTAGEKEWCPPVAVTGHGAAGATGAPSAAADGRALVRGFLAPGFAGRAAIDRRRGARVRGCPI